MAKRNWTLQLEGGRHTVELNHSAYSGKRTIRIDGQTVEESQKTVDLGSEHHFPLEGHQCTVVIRTHGLGFGYDLLLDGQPLAKRAPRPKPKPKPKVRQPAAPKKPKVQPPDSPYQFRFSGFLSLYTPYLILTWLLLAIGLVAALVGRTQSQNTLLVVGLLVLLGSLVPLIAPFRAAVDTIDWVAVDGQGLRWQDAAGDHALKWPEVSAVYQLEVRRNGVLVNELKVVPAASQPVTFDRSLSRYAQLVEEIQAHHTLAQQVHEADA